MLKLSKYQVLSNYHIYINILLSINIAHLQDIYIFTEHVNPFVLFALKAILVPSDSASDQVLI